MRGVLVFLAGCTLVPEPRPRDVDRDGDDVMAIEDCNDDNRGVSRLVPDSEVTCGDRIEDVFPIGRDAERYLEIFNCPHEVRDDDLISLRGPERVYVFRNEVATDVRIRLEGVNKNSGDRYLLANQGPWCTMDTCVLGRRSDDTVDFYAAANEGWYIVVSEGSLPWDITLNVDCATPD